MLRELHEARSLTDVRFSLTQRYYRKLVINSNARNNTFREFSLKDYHLITQRGNYDTPEIVGK